jgi:hypothetical protein
MSRSMTNDPFGLSLSKARRWVNLVAVLRQAQHERVWGIGQ